MNFFSILVSQAILCAVRIAILYICWNVAIVKLFTFVNPIAVWQMAMIYSTYIIMKSQISLKFSIPIQEEKQKEESKEENKN